MTWTVFVKDVSLALIGFAIGFIYARYRDLVIEK
jgi:hypothetical protein